MKLTPQDYIDATEDLSSIGFDTIKDQLKDGVAPAKIEQDLAVSERTIDVVATVSSYKDFETVVRLERQRSEAQVNPPIQVESFYKPKKDQSKRPTRLHYAISVFILIAIGYLVYRFIDLILSWIVAGF